MPVPFLDDPVAQAGFLGAVQGLTEFLPVSSSGHLSVLGHFLEIKTDALVFLTIWVHGATLAAVMAWHRRDVLGLIGLIVPAARRWGWSAEPGASSEDGGGATQLRGWPLVWALGLATVPAAVAALSGADDALEWMADRPRLVGLMLVCTGAIVFASRLVENRMEGKPARAITLGVAALIGCAQAVAIAPGISRSGSTIVAALALGAGRNEAVRFSFLMSIPAIGGALLMELRHGVPAGLEAGPLAAAAATSFLFGLAAIWLVKRFVERGKFWLFGAYCLTVGTLAATFA